MNLNTDNPIVAQLMTRSIDKDKYSNLDQNFGESQWPEYQWPPYSLYPCASPSYWPLLWNRYGTYFFSALSLGVVGCGGGRGDLLWRRWWGSARAVSPCHASLRVAMATADGAICLLWGCNEQNEYRGGGEIRKGNSAYDNAGIEWIDRLCHK